MMTYKLPSHKTPVSLVMDIVTFLGIEPESSIDKICSYTNKSLAYVRSGITVAEILGMLNKTEEGIYCVDKECTSLLGRTPDNETKINVFRIYLQRFEPFILFVQYINNGNNIEDAARKVYTIYNFEGKDYKFLMNLFISWGKLTEVLSVQDDTVLISEQVSTEAKQLNSLLLLNEDMSARLIIAKKLGEEAFAFLNIDEIEELVNGIVSKDKDCRKAIECAGRAFEDFLRRIAVKENVNVSKANGISQLASKLYYNKDAKGNLDSRIHNKQYSICCAIGDMRNMAGHGKESKTLERWLLTTEASILIISLVINTIRSIYLYVFEGNYLY